MRGRHGRVRVEDACLINTGLASQTASVARRVLGAIIAGQPGVVEGDIREVRREAQGQSEKEGE